MRNTIKLLTIAFLTFFIAGCSAIYEDGFEMANDSKNKVEQISVSQLNVKLESDDEYMLIDIRQYNEYLLGNIDGSVNIPRGILEFKIEDEDFWSEQYLYPPEKSTLIIIYCKSGNRGILAVRTLAQLGYDNVLNLEGGYQAFNPDFDESTAKPQESGGCGG